MIRDDFTVDVLLPYPTGDELGILRAKIDDDNLMIRGRKGKEKTGVGGFKFEAR